jgi:hypothetical protein
MTETPGQRLYRIRLACGDGVRNAESLKAFAARVRRKTKQSYSAMTLSLLERMEQNWKLADVEAFAAVDPLHRGRVWLAGWEEALAAEPEIGPALTEPPATTHRPAAARSLSGGQRSER